MRLAFSYKFLVVQFYKVEMKIRPCVPHFHADEVKGEKKRIGRCALKWDCRGKNGGSQQMTIRKRSGSETKLEWRKWKGLEHGHDKRQGFNFCTL